MAAKEIVRRGVITLPKELIGTNAERLAYSTTELPIGSTFLETDTKAVYIYDGSSWNAL